MKLKKFTALFRGLAATMAALLVLAVVGYEVADTYRSAVDDVLGTTSIITTQDKENMRFKSDYENVDELYKAAKAHAIKQGEEGTVIMKNDNSVLPLAKGKTLALFGSAAYQPYKGDGAAGGLHGGNEDEVDLVKSFTKAGFTLDDAPKGIYDALLSITETKPGGWGGSVTTYPYGINTDIGDMTYYKVNEVPANKLAEIASANANWADSIVKNDTIGIVVFQRPGGENNTYAPKKVSWFDGTQHEESPLKLTPDELSIVDLAKDKCSKVIVLINSANAMEIGDIAKGGAHEVDGIAYIGVPNDFQCEGIVNVLTGKVNASGALPDTYLYDNTSAPAAQNFGGAYFTNYDIAGTEKGGEDPRFPGQTITNDRTVSSFGASGNMYSGGYYIVEAEGIYVGYNYFETRYYDSIVNTSYKANSAKGSTQDKDAWNYGKEVVYSFGHGLSYLDYEQNIKSVSVDKVTNEGNITAVIEIKNKSNQDGLFLAQLYVQQPYTQYDITNKVEKSAIMFLSSKKVNVEAGKSATVTIEVPAKYLASYDYTNAKTYILDEGNYYFTAAAGAHEAVNNILTKQGHTGDAEGKGAVAIWNNAKFDATTYSVDNGYKVTNVADNADINYWLPGSVTYLTRSNWETYPENYSAMQFDIATSPKKAEWIKEVRGMQYTIDNTGKEVENVNGKDNGVKFTADYVQLEQINNINDEYWDKLVKSISVDQAVGGVIHGGNQTDEYDFIDNAIIKQYEGPNGISGASAKSVDESRTYNFNISSQTLLAASFNPDLAYEWGEIEGESALYMVVQTAWGTGLTQRRTPYNARNLEYISEDAMLTNRIGYGIVAGGLSKGFLCGPKHMGFNDQEHTRSGISAYMTEQKMRETDLRGFQGALDDAHGLAVMIAFNRIGATNASHHVGMLKHIVREEWGFKGLISTDMATNPKYFVAESMIMATITQVADFAANDNFISKGTGGVDKTWAYLSVDNVKNDATLVNQARENLKYQFYAFANSTAMNISTEHVTPWWEAALKAVIGVSAALLAVSGVAWVVSVALPEKKKEEE